MSAIDRLAVVSPQAFVGVGVEIGPFSVVEPDVVVEDGCRLSSHVVIKRGTHLGEDTQVSEGAVLGGHPQHLRAGDQLGPLRIGRGNVIREHVTIHRGLTAESSTVVGDHNLIMVNAHIAHDCHVGHHTIIANNVMLAGHVHVGDRAYLSGAVGVHQFCRVGAYAMVGGQAHIHQDVPPYVTVDGITTQVVGLNLVGLRRAGFSSSDIVQLKAAYRVMFRQGLTWKEVLAVLERDFATGPAASLHAFLSGGSRGFVGERRAARRGVERTTIPLADASRDERRRAA